MRGSRTTGSHQRRNQMLLEDLKLLNKIHLKGREMKNGVGGWVKVLGAAYQCGTKA